MSTEGVDALWFDGTHSRGRAVRVERHGSELRLVDTLGGVHVLPLGRIEWPERTRHGRRVAQLEGGGTLEFTDATAFDAWRRAGGHRESWVVRAQQHWRATAAALALLLAVAAAGYVWGVPWISARVVAAVPATAERTLGDAALAQLRESMLAPSKTDAAVQRQWQQRLDAALAAAWPGTAPRITLHVVGGGRIGPNALALPGGHVLITDELLALLAGADDAVLGVLAHEAGHVRRRHGLNALVRFTLLSGATSVALGDFSAVLAGLPALLGTLGYSRDAEREADADAAAVLRAAGRSPAAMVVLFERLAEKQGERGGPPIAFASHPADEERIAFFRDAAR